MKTSQFIELLKFVTGLLATHYVFEASKIGFNGFGLILYTFAYLLITKEEFRDFFKVLR